MTSPASAEPIGNGRRSRIACGLWEGCQKDEGLHDVRCPASGQTTARPPEPTDDDRAKAIVAMSQALRSDRLTVGHAITLVAHLLASQRAEIVARYEAVADELDRFSDDAQFEWDRAGDAQQMGQRDAFDVAVSRIREAAPK